MLIFLWLLAWPGLVSGLRGPPFWGDVYRLWPGAEGSLKERRGVPPHASAGTRRRARRQVLGSGRMGTGPDHRDGAEGALRIIRQFRQRGCVVVSVRKSWLNTAPEVQDVLVAFAGWMAQQESSRRSEPIRAGLERRQAEGKPVGRQPGSADNKPRRRSGYVASWESGRRRAAQDVRAPRRGAGAC
jgi:hypothetical protein